MLAQGTILQSRYRIMRLLAQGGMGAVYLAKDERLGRVVALKESLLNEEMLRKQFEREASLLANLRHPVLPKVMDHFTEDGGQFIVMEYIPGDDLMQMLEHRGGAFPLDEVLAWANQLLGALEYLHRRQPPVIHRDIKPHNLKLTEEGLIVLLDFGLSKGTAMNTDNSFYGYTRSYAPLEQIRGMGTDPRSDLYSLGATLYHLLTGVRPADVITRLVDIGYDQGDPLTPADKVNPQVTPAIAEVLNQAMSLKREQRLVSAMEMRRALNDAARYSARDGDGNERTISPRPLVEPLSQQPVPEMEEQKIAETAEQEDEAQTTIPISAVAKPLAAEDQSPTLPSAMLKQKSLPMWIVVAMVISMLAAMAAGFVRERQEAQQRRLKEEEARYLEQQRVEDEKEATRKEEERLMQEAEAIRIAEEARRQQDELIRKQLEANLVRLRANPISFSDHGVTIKESGLGEKRSKQPEFKLYLKKFYVYAVLKNRLHKVEDQVLSWQINVERPDGYEEEGGEDEQFVASSQDKVPIQRMFSNDGKNLPFGRYNYTIKVTSVGKSTRTEVVEGSFDLSKPSKKQDKKQTRRHTRRSSRR